MANFEIINGKLVPTAINEVIVTKSSGTNAMPNKEGEKAEKEEILVDGKKLKKKLLQLVKHLNRGKLTIEDEALNKIFDTINKHQKFDAFFDDEKFEETFSIKDEIENALDDLTTAQLKHIRDYIKGLK
jgi:hypothetical protein